MARVSINLEDTPDGQVAVLFGYDDGFDTNSHAHQHALLIQKWMDDHMVQEGPLVEFFPPEDGGEYGSARIGDIVRYDFKWADVEALRGDMHKCCVERYQALIAEGMITLGGEWLKDRVTGEPFVTSVPLQLVCSVAQDPDNFMPSPGAGVVVA